MAEYLLLPVEEGFPPLAPCHRVMIYSLGAV